MKLTIAINDVMKVEANMVDDMAINHPILFKEMFNTMYEELLAQLTAESSKE